MPQWSKFTIRQLVNDEICRAFPIILQLREHLDILQFQERVDLQKASGYTLHGAIDSNGFILGVIGLRPVCTLARGLHLHIDDLLVNTPDRGRGIGHSLLRYAEDLAISQGMGSIFIDSRPDVKVFYQLLGYLPHSATLMRKSIRAEPKPTLPD